MKIKKQNLLCFNCSNIFPDKYNNKIICPICGYEIGREKYNGVIDYSSNAAKYGYLYREEYQNQMQKGDSIKLYGIESSEIINFIAVAAMSGIIGSASYDLIKLAINNIKKKHNKITGSGLKNFLKNEMKSTFLSRIYRITTMA